MDKIFLLKREGRCYSSNFMFNIIMNLILGIGFLFSSLYAQTYDFNNGTVQGWTGPYLSSDDPDWNGLSFVFDDYINYPNTSYDPVDRNGSISIQTLQTLSDSPTGIQVEFRSPDLSNNRTWQNAYGWKGQLMFLGDIGPGDPFPGAYLELSTGHEILIGEPLEVYQGFGWHEITVYFPKDIPGFKWFSLRFNYPDGLKDMGGEEGIYGGIFLDNVEPILELEPKAPEVGDIPNQSIAEGGSFATINLDSYVSDEDNSDEEMKWSFSGNTDLTVTINESRVATIGIPNENWNGSETITFTATDPDELSDSDAATFEVTAENDAPIVANPIPDQEATEDVTFTYTFPVNTFNDVDVGDNLTYTAILSDDSVLPGWLSFIAATRHFSGTPGNAHVGTITIKVTAIDNSMASVSDEFDLEVLNTNDPPIVANQIPDQQATEDVPYNYVVPANTFNDIDTGDNLTYTATLSDDSALPAWLTFTAATRTFSGTPSNANVGTITVKVTATDDLSASVSDEFMLTVDNVNDPPHFVSDLPEVMFPEDSSSTHTISDFYDYYQDPDGPDTIFVVLSGDFVTIEEDYPMIAFKAPDNWFGADTLTVIASDGELSDTAFVYVTVKSINDAPVFVNLPDTVEFIWSEEAMLVMNDYAVDNDLPNDSLRWLFDASDGALNYDFSPETSELTFPAQDFTGMVTLYCTVSDDSGASALDSFVVNVTADLLGINDLANGIPIKYELHQNYPNPFNPVTHIIFGLPKAGDIRITVYNILGQQVATILESFKSAGYHIVEFDAGYLPSGLYYYRMQTSEYNDVRKMILVK